MPILLAMIGGGIAFGLIIIWETRHERRTSEHLKGYLG